LYIKFNSMIRTLLVYCSFIFMIAACKPDEILIKSGTNTADISRMLQIQKKLTSNSLIPIWNIFDQPMTANEKQALEFLYAYMPLSDLADYPPSFFLANVKQTLKARNDFTWGKTVPEDIFLHFVLPIRVNNENLDSFRLQLYDEIRTRVQGMGMAQAALEINHWCHEKVTYRGTDIRTSAPLSTIRKSFGRCGEESTFTVSAMRAAGIPARQVYTPRWAHVDDNHAWVEVWINGKWNYLGACEPEPALNMAWFSEPSRRVMLVHTRSYGRYALNNDEITAADRFSELNLTSGYAPVKKTIVIVKDQSGRSVQDARVEFGLYNYAEFFLIASRYTDKTGTTSLSTGLGTLLIWASRGASFDYRMISVAESDTLVLTLGKTSMTPHTELYDLIPPHATKVNLQVTKAQKLENDRRLGREDSIRHAYMATFRDSLWSVSLAGQLALNPDTVVRIIAQSFGNWPEMKAYLVQNAKQHPKTVLTLASQLSDKDFSDARARILTDHLVNTSRPAGMDPALFEKWVLSPRIGDENLSAWRSFLQANLSTITGSARGDVPAVISWIQNHIAINDEANMHSRAPISPIGVFNLRVADRISRDIFFVACCRSMGIPARLNPVNRMTEYYTGDTWQQVNLDNPSELPSARGMLELRETKNPLMPQYYIHFTLARLNNGHYETLVFDEGRNLSDFPPSMPMDTGRYMLVTGNRMEDGSVLTSLHFFTIRAGQVTRVPVFIRLIPGTIKPSGKLNLDSLLLSVPGQPLPQRLTALASGKKIVILLLDPDQEPSRHVLDELASYTDNFNKWEGRFLLAMPRNKSTVVSVLKPYNLPNENAQGIDVNNNICKALETIYGHGLSDKLPLVILCDQDGLVYLFSSGYKIGLGEQLLKFTR
jgi:hypothetical protein